MGRFTVCWPTFNVSILLLICLLLLSFVNHNRNNLLIKCQSIDVVDNDNTQAPNFILFGSGLHHPNLIFPSRYFFVFHQSRKVKLDSIVIRYRDPVIKSGQPVLPQKLTNCRLWTQTLNQSHFCLKFKPEKLQTFIAQRSNHNAKKQGDVNPFVDDLELNDLFELAEDYCDDDDHSDLDDNDDLLIQYHLSIVRYRLYLQDKCDIPLQVIVQYDEKEKPSNQKLQFQVNIETLKKFDDEEEEEDILYSDQCNCPRPEWSDEMRCLTLPANVDFLQKQIEPSLKPFKDGINFDLVFSEAIERFATFPRTYSFCLYQIVSNQLYRKCFGEYVGFARFFDEILLSLLQKTPLGDTEFLVNLGDWPLSEMSSQRLKTPPLPLPIFSWCGSTDSFDIVLPTYELTESILHAQTRISNDIFSIFGHQPSSFEEKENRLFWRGRDSNRARLKLIKLSFENPELFNVSITNFFFFRDEMAEYTTTTTTVAPSTTDSDNSFNYNSAHIPFRSFFDYRYQINVDGTVAAYRFPFLLAGNSLTIKQRSMYYEFYYHLLESGKHYLEVDENLDNLIELLRELLDETNNSTTTLRSKQIIWNARRFVLLYLLPENIYCYYYNVLVSYTKLLLPPSGETNAQIKLRDGVEIVELEKQQQPDNNEGDDPEYCQCRQSKLKSNQIHQSSNNNNIKDEL